MLQTGLELGGYRIERLLGRGAMGTVYRGTHLTDGAVAAIKTVHGDLLAGKEREAILARFRQEAEIGMRLRHPLIVRVHNYGEQDNLLYLIMEFVDGQELGRLLAQRPDVSLVMGLAIVLQLLSALASAHQAGVIHRDIKPANIMIRQDYTIALTDFGIAHLSGSELTQIGELLGSPLYMAPEQLRGEPVDGRSDLFSTGVLLYLLLTGRKPFIADSLAALMHKILHDQPAPPSAVNPAVPAAFDAILWRALAKQPAHRFASAAEFAAVLREARTNVLQANRIGPAPASRRSARSSEAALDQATILIPSAETLIQPLAALVEECIVNGATDNRIQQLAERLTLALAILDRPEQDDYQQRLQNWRTGWPLPALEERILGDAPLPGRPLREARGDWLGLIRVVTLLRNAGHRLGDTPKLDVIRTRIIDALTGAFLSYSGMLNQQLFSGDGPQLKHISADLMRLDLLQLALEELNADLEARNVRLTLRLFANQIMSRVNALIRQFLGSHDPLAHFDVANLLVEVEELIALAERLLDNSDGIALDPPGGVTMAEFIENVRGLEGVLTGELIQRLRQEQQHLQETGRSIFYAGQTAFVGRLRQLGLLYRFVVHWQAGYTRMDALRQLATDMHHRLEDIADALLEALKTDRATRSALTTDLLWARLTVLADLAEQFGWPELHRRVLLAARRWVQTT